MGIFQKVINDFGVWSNSIVGAIIITIATLAVCRMILTVIREKKDKQGVFYRNSKTAAIAICLISAINMIYKIGIRQTSWTLTIILIGSYAVILAIAFDKNRKFLIIIDTALLILGVYLIKSLGATINLGVTIFISLIIGAFSFDHVRQYDAREFSGTNRLKDAVIKCITGEER